MSTSNRLVHLIANTFIYRPLHNLGSEDIVPQAPTQEQIAEAQLLGINWERYDTSERLRQQISSRLTTLGQIAFEDNPALRIGARIRYAFPDERAAVYVIVDRNTEAEHPYVKLQSPRGRKKERKVFAAYLVNAQEVQRN